MAFQLFLTAETTESCASSRKCFVNYPTLLTSTLNPSSAVYHAKLMGEIKLVQFLDSTMIFNLLPITGTFVNSAEQDRLGIFDKCLHFFLSPIPKILYLQKLLNILILE